MSEPCARPSHPEAGFTLVETLVALAVLALLLGTLATTLNVMGNAMRRGSRDIDRVDMIARGLAAVRRDMMRMERVVARDKTGTRFVFSGTRQSVSFVVVEPNYPAEPGSYQISYDVRGSGAAAELVRTRDAYEPDRAPAKGKRDESSDVVVLEGPYRFAFSFLERDGTRVRWVERWSNRRRLPRSSYGRGWMRRSPASARSRRRAR